MPVATESPVRRIPFSRLADFPELFATYCSDYPALSGYFSGDFRDATARRAAAERAADHPRDRDALADVLLEQNTHFTGGAALDAATRANLGALRDPTSVAVVTGQQVGLFTGPLYTLYKTLTALQLSERLAEETGRPIVPVFWLEGEDHDVAEVSTTHVLRRNELAAVRYDAAPFEGENPGPVGRLSFTEQIEDVLSNVDAILPSSDFKPALMERLRLAYQPGVTHTEAFARCMRALLPEAGLVFIDPDDRRLKALAAPLFRNEIEDPEASAQRVSAAGGQLEAAGYHQQVLGRPSNLFLLGEEEGRSPLDFEDERFVLRGTERSFSQKELLDLLDETPEHFSPNVVLRPIVQDTLLPTALYVAGPGEVSYFAQYRGVYEWAGVPMPLVYPRASATLVEGKVQRVLDKAGLTLPDVAGDLEQLFQRVVKREMDTDVDALFSDATRPMHQAFNGLKPEVEAVDGSLGGSVEAARAALIQAMNELKGKVVRAEKRKQDEVHAQLEKAHVNLFPNEELQERTISPLYFLNKYSLDLTQQLRATLSIDTTAHQVVAL